MWDLMVLKFGLILSIYALCKAEKWGKNEQWTEEKESRRLQMIKDEEKRLFKLELSRQPGYSPELYDDRFLGSGDLSVEQTGSVYGPQWSRNTQDTWPQMGVGSSQQSQRRNPPQEPPRIHSLPLISSSQSANKTNWCFYCASPLRILSSDLRRAIENLLKVRRTQYPFDAVNEKCSSPENINALPKQQCLHSYCQTLTLIDHQTATAFTMRGCAENFAAVNIKLLENREDNTCDKLHDNLDLQECICKHRKYCYKGSERKNLYIDDDSNVISYASGSHAKSIAISHKMNNSSLGFIIMSFMCSLYFLYEE